MPPPVGPEPETSVEVASGIVTGVDPVREREPRPDDTGAALRALERAVLPALRRPPCLVTFSGGTDSSSVLAVAVRAARRHGLPDPIPFTWRYPFAPATDETAWQREVVAALGLCEWIVVSAGRDELDFVGPLAGETLLRHGVRHPANLFVHARPAELAAGGSLLTGAGGDQVLSGWLRPENRTWHRRLKNRMPAGLRVTVRRLPHHELPWLRRSVASRVLRAQLREEADEPVASGSRARWHGGRRDLVLGLDNLRRLGESWDTRVSSPLADASFVRALAAESGERPAPRRWQLLAELLGDAVPPVVWQLRRKARFGDVFVAGPSYDLARRWDGEGVDPEIVDVQELRRVWREPTLPLGTAGLLQQVRLTGLGPTRLAERAASRRATTCGRRSVA